MADPNTHRYLSLDTEATGLTEDCLLIQLAFVPIDVQEGLVLEESGVEWLVQCPAFEELKPRLNPWVIEHNEGLIRRANSDGIAVSKLRQEVADYLDSPKIKKFFGGERPILLGKSLSALDIPLLTRTFGWEFMNQRFHHHTIDVTGAARFLIDCGVLPQGTASTSKIIKHYGIREGALHTALSDAVDMARIYVKMVDTQRSVLDPSTSSSRASKKGN